ncbi:unnamed protein product [Adineta steineri]|uniref:Alpha/beta hydrolase fold-3 domain-containing protein n=2 Tax=Adineta steineri TaxID=433720 RepID=A0A813Q356_9BILA|nr:unnamed protein product [Adineta steineri]CAF3882695.1 unnamed protein product [Adineta steineri]
MSKVNKKSPYDPELEQVLEKMRHAGSIFSCTLNNIPTFRKHLLTVRLTDEQLHRNGAIDSEERKVPGPEGAPEITLLICRPSALKTNKSKVSLPCIYFIHGGGMIVGDNRFSLQPLLDWIVELNIIIVSVEYRLAPEHPHPAPSEDCYAGLLWTASHAQDLGIDVSQLSVAGASAGGGLAAAMALMARDRGGPTLQGQLLFSPMLDDRDQTFSTHQFEGMGIWDRQSNLCGWTALLGDQKGSPDVSPYAAPSRAQDLSNLPSAFIDVGSAETFRDEDIDYAQRIGQAGGTVELHVWSGGFHGFTGVAPHAVLSKQANETSKNWYRRLLASHKK